MEEKNRSDNTIKDSNGKSLDIYENDIYALADSYINSLPEDTRTYMYNNGSNMFTGMIKYINRNYFRGIKDIYNNITVLDYIWNVYTDLVYKYMQKPTIQEFAILLGINRDTIYSWMHGETRADYSDELGSSRSDTVKKWIEECKMGRYKGAQAGNVGCIFLCKAVDGMVETAPVQVENKVQRKSTAEIEQEYSNNQIGTTANNPPKADF